MLCHEIPADADVERLAAAGEVNVHVRAGGRVDGGDGKRCGPQGKAVS